MGGGLVNARFSAHSHAHTHRDPHARTQKNNPIPYSPIPNAALSPPDGCAADSDQRGRAYCKNINMQQAGGRRGDERGGVGSGGAVKRKQRRHSKPQREKCRKRCERVCKTLEGGGRRSSGVGLGRKRGTRKGSRKENERGRARRRTRRKGEEEA